MRGFGLVCLCLLVSACTTVGEDIQNAKARAEMDRATHDIDCRKQNLLENTLEYHQCMDALAARDGDVGQ